MPCNTAKRWFVPDQEDYALVNIPESVVRANINKYDNAVRGLFAEDEYFSSYRGLYNKILSPSSCPLIYADVDDTNSEHKQKLKERAIQEDSCQPNEEFASFRDKFIAAQVDGHRFDHDTETGEQEKEYRVH